MNYQTDNNIYTYKNFGFIFKKIFTWLFVIISTIILIICLITKLPQVLVIIPISVVMGWIFFVWLPLKDGLEYEQILVDNKNKYLKITRTDKSEITFQYDDIEKISYNTIWKPMLRRSLITITIHAKDKNEYLIKFSNMEFSTSFLKKMQNITIEKQQFNAFPIVLWIIIFVLIFTTCIIFSTIYQNYINS